MSPTADFRALATRRSFLRTAAAGAVVATAGCVGSGASNPEPTGEEISVEWRLDPESTGEYEHRRTLRDEERDRTWFEGSFVATDSGVVGFEHEHRFYREGEEIDRWRSDFEPGEYSSLFVMDPGEATTYEYALEDAPVPTSFEVLVEQIYEE